MEAARWSVRGLEGSDTARARSAAGDDGEGGVTVVVLAAMLVEGGSAWIGVASGDLHVAERDAGVQGGIINAARNMWG